jgi:hypothetical protein
MVAALPAAKATWPSLIDDRWCDQRHQTGIPGGNPPLIGNTPGGRPRNLHTTGIEKRVGINGAGGRNKTGNIHHRGGSEQDPVRIHQHDNAVGIQIAEDLRRAGASRDAVQHRGGAAGLHELNGISGADIERLPVDHRTARTLVDRQLVGDHRIDGGRAVADAAIRRQPRHRLSPGCRTQAQGNRQRQRLERERPPAG